MLLAFVCFRAVSDETELPTPNHPAVHDPKGTHGSEFAYREFMERAGKAVSFRLNIVRPDHLCPLLGFVSDELAEVGR
jgi:hypothetical protein